MLSSDLLHAFAFSRVNRSRLNQSKLLLTYVYFLIWNNMLFDIFELSMISEIIYEYVLYKRTTLVYQHDGFDEYVFIKGSPPDTK